MTVFGPKDVSWGPASVMSRFWTIRGQVSMVFQGNFMVFHGLVGFHGFPWFLVGFNGFSRWFHGFWSLSMVNGPRLVKSELSAAGAK